MSASKIAQEVGHGDSADNGGFGSSGWKGWSSGCGSGPRFGQGFAGASAGGAWAATISSNHVGGVGFVLGLLFIHEGPSPQPTAQPSILGRAMRGFRYNSISFSSAAVSCAFFVCAVGCQPTNNPLTVGWLPRGADGNGMKYLHAFDGLGSLDFSAATPGSTEVGVAAGIIIRTEGTEYLPLGELAEGGTIHFGVASLSGGEQENYDTFIKGTWTSVDDWEFPADYYDQSGYGEDCPTDGELWERARDQLGMIGYYSSDVEDASGYDREDPHIGVPSAEPLQRDATGYSMSSTYQLAHSPIYEVFCNETLDCAEAYEGETVACRYARESGSGEW